MTPHDIADTACVPAHYPSVLRINLESIKQNYLFLKEKAEKSCAVAGLVKANAYGVGMAQVSEVLYEQGCRSFFVATPEEGLALRALLQGRAAEIFVLGGLYKGAEDLYTENHLTPVLSSPDDLAHWKAQCSAKNLSLASYPCALHFDTGMNRLGFTLAETQALLDDPSVLGGVTVTLVMSHFACADEKDHPLTEKQAQAFSSLARAFPHARKSLANSSGLFRGCARGWLHDMVRPGYALYGGNPLPEEKNPLNPVVRLDTKILQVHDVKKGQTIGYGASYTVPEDTKLATVALGYADGFLRAAAEQNREAPPLPALWWKGQACPLRGRISMDLTIVELPSSADTSLRPPQRGDFLEVIGPHQDIDRLAPSRGTIGYEILTSLGQRHYRLYEK